MKKYFVFAALCSTVIACNSSDNKGGEQKPADNAANSAANDKALEMIGSSDCMTCHKLTEKNIGPAYSEVAKKYEATDANIETLAHKVINGGTGNWGSLPMTPHPTLSLDSAKEMVRYILSIKEAK
jgi:cytochrome c